MPVPIAIAVVQSEGRFLVGRRPAGVPLAGMWEFPGGRMASGETAEQAAVRECFEETGITIAVERTVLRHVHHYDHAEVELHFLACRPIGPVPAPQGAFRWVPRAALNTLDFPQGNEKLIELLSRGDGA